MLMFSTPQMFPEVSTFFPIGVDEEANCIDAVVTTLRPSFFPDIRGEQTIDKHRVSDEAAPLCNPASSLPEYLLPHALALRPNALSLVVPHRSGEKNKESFMSCSTRTPEGWIIRITEKKKGVKRGNRK